MTISRATRSVIAAAIWIFVWLAVLDVAVGWGVRTLERRNPASGIVKYFQYGLSIETKLDTQTAQPPGSLDSKVLSAGWLDPVQWHDLPDKPAVGSDLLVALYGQSFAFNATRETVRMDGHMTLRGIGGPAAAADHSFAAYELDAPLRHANVVVFGILASSVARIGSISGASSNFEHPAPFTYPHFRLSSGVLAAEWPVLRTEAEFREAFAANSGKWAEFKAQLARDDRGYDPIAFDRTWADKSQIALLLRRGWVAHNQDYNQGVYDSRTGFHPDSEPVQVLNALLGQLQRDTRARGERLIVLLEQDQGYGNALFNAVAHTLQTEQIEFINSSSLFSADDPHNFVADGHYSPEANGVLATALLHAIRDATRAPG